MPRHEHGQRPSDDEPPPPDELDAACRRMLAETLRPCRELSRDERAEKRKADRAQQRQLEEWAAEAEASVAALRAG